VSIAKRVLARYLKADLTPPLGYPGGPCQVVERIEHDIRNPRMKQDLVDDVETNKKVTNQDASKIYHLEQERGVGIIKRLQIAPHAQYRMDLRAVTVPAVRAALASLSKLYFSLKSQKGPQFQTMDRELRSGKHYTWTDPKMGLTIVFVLEGADTAVLITCYWAGDHDPTAHPGECSKTASTPEETGAASFTDGFFKRHPRLRKYASIKVLDKSGSGGGSHPEARQTGGQILLFPKFWSQDASTRDFIFAHEIGHWVLSEFGSQPYLKALTEAGIDGWDSDSLPFGQFNMDEAFADCFASHALVPGELERRYPAWVTVLKKIAD
jgi:hypothetical protein